MQWSATSRNRAEVSRRHGAAPKRRGGVVEEAEWNCRPQSIDPKTAAVVSRKRSNAEPTTNDARTRKDVGIKRRTY